MSNSSNNNNDDNNFPWAWFKAVQDVLKEDPPTNIPDPPVAVLPWLYLAPLYCVRNREEKVRELGITHVLSTNRMPPQTVEYLYWELRSHEIDHLYIAADDTLTYHMLQHWEECKEFLQQALDQKGKVLVHCAAGMNRSGVIVAMAMIHFAKMDLLEVVRRLKEKRGYVLSNQSFLKQLVRFAAQEGRLGEKPEGYSDYPATPTPEATYRIK